MVSWITIEPGDFQVSEAASIQLDGLNFEFLNFPVQVEEETHFLIHITDDRYINNIKQVKARIEGVNMYMGVVQVLMTEPQPAPRLLKGSFFLGSCAEPKMSWRMFINIELQDGEKIQQFLDFSTTL